jgi:hypothetical protein
MTATTTTLAMPFLEIEGITLVRGSRFEWAAIRGFRL